MITEEVHGAGTPSAFDVGLHWDATPESKQRLEFRRREGWAAVLLQWKQGKSGSRMGTCLKSPQQHHTHGGLGVEGVNPNPNPIRRI